MKTTLKGISLLYNRDRFAILTGIACGHETTFVAIQKARDLPPGSLSQHVAKLTRAGFLRSKRTFNGKYRTTHYVVTAAGRRAIDEYIAVMEATIAAVLGANTERTSGASPSGVADGSDGGAS